MPAKKQEKEKKAGGLTILQDRFCLEYWQAESRTEAAIKAGYSPKTAGRNADRLMKDQKILARLEEIKEKLEGEKIAEAKEVLRFLTATMRGETKCDFVVIEAKGCGESKARVIKAGPTDKQRVKAAETLAKKYGLLTEKQEQKVSGSITFIDDVTPKAGGGAAK